MRGPEAKNSFVQYVKEHYGIDLSAYQQQCQQNQTVNQNQARFTQQPQYNQNLNTQPQIQAQVRNQVQTQAQQYVDSKKLLVFKNYIDKKYSSKIDSFSTEKLQTILTKIDEVEQKILQSTAYSADKKQLYITVLEALKQIIQEKLQNSADSIINSVLGE
jgi:hypothetical protein